jgi:HemY protein
MALLLKLLAVVAVAVGAVALLGDGPGYVLVQAAGYTLETTAAFALVVLLLVLVLGWLVWALLRGAWGLPGRLAEARRSRRRERSLHYLESGLLSLERGHPDRARKTLVRGARLAEHPGPFYLEAARAARAAGRTDDADGYLREAQAGQRGDAVAARLMRADLERDAGRPEHARALLADLGERHRDNPEVLRRLLPLERSDGDWETVLELVPRASKAGVLSDAEAVSWTVEARAAGLAEAYEADDAQRMERLWSDADKDERARAGLVRPRLCWLLERGRADEALDVLGRGLKRSWSEELVELYYLFPGDPSDFRYVSHAERWLKDHPEDPVLLAVLARLAVAAQWWGKADQYLDAAAARADQARVLLRLAELYAERGRPEEALSAARQARAALEAEDGVSCSSK